MISRPLSPLRNTTRRRPPPAGASLVVSQCTRKPPVSLVKVSVCLSPRPAQLPIGFQTTTDSGWGACWGPQLIRNRAAARPKSARFGRNVEFRIWNLECVVIFDRLSARIPNSKFLLPNSPRWAHHFRRDVTAEAADDENPGHRRRRRYPCVRGPCRRADLHERRGADPSEVLSKLSSPGADGADVADDLSGRPAVGALDQAARHRAADAALGHRSARGDPELQERSLAARR